ncbi:MAG: hypothetical protein NAG76_03905 [Candidatus Pristimantibacillus lignocellulolyticus]|uniref:histidine kinase n=1 Tax=Candidatus Pristimantibacillus lignocellulolyticus TaxID=2994561 RepID=A0A9J6ZGY0_9BACL|nr:MAG: hypothetical protein NAG76_03905 [Candidatus Pristimantibacillus lignocellulolyticus]
MKLVHQINIAFGIALVLVLSITAILIHYVLLDHFIVTQQADMKSVGMALTDTLKAEMMTGASSSDGLTINDLFGRLLIVFCIGGLLIMVLSHFITKRLITPLIKLKEELTKVKERQFVASVNLVKAGGEIGAVAQTVYEMADELNRFNRAQKEFFQNASHELKSPLMSIAGYTEGIRDCVFEGRGKCPQGIRYYFK